MFKFRYLHKYTLDELDNRLFHLHEYTASLTPYFDCKETFEEIRYIFELIRYRKFRGFSLYKRKSNDE